MHFIGSPSLSARSLRKCCRGQETGTKAIPQSFFISLFVVCNGVRRVPTLPHAEAGECGSVELALRFINHCSFGKKNQEPQSRNLAFWQMSLFYPV